MFRMSLINIALPENLVKQKMTDLPSKSRQ
uniref:Uncharacterized protein n=1 Tax=Siphoviridae sp. ctxMM9 TaxID=2827973 RepID=A0A8S5T7N4_9CAUD|nr:MAG TPA: hypothetical protein [Siphoviridae sp. ctxMM9]